VVQAYHIVHKNNKRISRDVHCSYVVFVVFMVEYYLEMVFPEDSLHELSVLGRTFSVCQSQMCIELVVFEDKAVTMSEI
jgi:hypothetical protein